MRILITGTAGFIGSNLVDHFLARGREGSKVLNKTFEWLNDLSSLEYNFDEAG